MRGAVIPGSELRPLEPLFRSPAHDIAIQELNIDLPPAGPAVTDADHFPNIGRLIAKARRAKFSPSDPAPYFRSHIPPRSWSLDLCRLVA